MMRLRHVAVSHRSEVVARRSVHSSRRPLKWPGRPPNRSQEGKGSAVGAGLLPVVGGFRIADVGTRSVVGNVLVVSTVDHPEDVLRRYVGEGDKLKVVVPVVRQGVLDWLANDQKAFSHAEHVAEDMAAHLPGETVEAKAGEADVDLAIRDALATFAADEIVVAVRPTDQEGKVESVATASAPTKSLHGIPVRFVVIRE
jgi:hypothetical protein